MELHYEEGNTLRSIIISHQPREKQNLTVVKISLREDFGLCLWRFREQGKEANEWLAKKKIKMLPLILLASEMGRAGLALFSSLSEIAECMFFNPKKQASCLYLRAEVSWVVFVCRAWCKCFYFCLFNLCAFSLCLPFRTSLNLAFLQIANWQQISALPSVFFLRWHANTRKPRDSSSSWEVDAAEICKEAVQAFLPHMARIELAAASPIKGGRQTLNPLANLHLASAPQSHKSTAGPTSRPWVPRSSWQNTAELQVWKWNPGELEDCRNNAMELQMHKGEEMWLWESSLCSWWFPKALLC